MVTRKVAPALAAGCTVVLKPAESTPLTAAALAELARRAGVPPGAFNLVSGDAPAIGDALLRDPAVRKLGFTGSTAVGKALAAKAAATVKRVSLELGGNAPFIVCADADLDAAATALAASAFRNAGQTCISASRALVAREDATSRCCSAPRARAWSSAGASFRTRSAHRSRSSIPSTRRGSHWWWRRVALQILVERMPLSLPTDAQRACEV